MSPPLTSRNPDLARIVKDGYELSILHGHLVITGVPYVNSKREIRLGTLVSDMSSISGDVTASPVTAHVAMWAGEYPCDSDGNPIEKFRHASTDQVLGPNLTVNHSFSHKPQEGYRDYHHKMTTYVAMIARHAQAIDKDVSAQTHRFIENDDPDSPFHYADTASGRVGITNVMRKLELARIGIFGVGGTGSYVLDLVAKTPVREIAIFDGDTFLQHNAFRAPGAPTPEELQVLPKKVDYLAGIYSRMHRGIVPHAFAIDEHTIGQVGPMDFAFICMDSGTPKRLLVEHFEQHGVPFIDVGMGVELIDDDGLTGLVCVTTSTLEARDHVRANRRLSFKDGGKDNVYAKNIQIADLNALNAAMAVIRWKKHFGFYRTDPKVGPDNLNRQLEKYIWNGKSHLHLKDLWEYLNRYTYLPRVKNRAVLQKAVHTAVSGMLSGPFAYAERWDQTKEAYVGLAVSGATGAQVVIDDQSVIIKPGIAEAYVRKQTAAAAAATITEPTVSVYPGAAPQPAPGAGSPPTVDPKPTRFQGTVMISPERPARDIHQIVEAIIEQLTTLPGADVSIKLEIDAEVPAGLERAKVRTLIENATTLGFVDKQVK